MLDRPFLSGFLGSNTAPVTAPDDDLRRTFGSWLPDAKGTDPDIEGLLFNFWYPDELEEPKFVYLRVSAELILWHLARGEVAQASAVADVLITWQSTANDTGAEQARRGGFPSIVAEDPGDPGEWIAAASVDGTGTPRYYSHDALVVIKALLELYRRRPDAAYLTAATLAGDFIVRQSAALIGTYRHATEKGPVDFVDHDGNYSSHIYGTVAYAYLGGMDMLAELLADQSYSDCADDARAFFALGQHAQGWWYDHYEPAFPPTTYDASKWKKFHEGNNQILADNVMHAALGAAMSGDTAAAQATFDWLIDAVDPSGGVPGYLTPGATATHGFGVQDVYFDVVSTGEWRSLCQWLDEQEAAEQAVLFCEAAQAEDGGFLWGLFAELGLDATGDPDAQAPHTGIWCTADISVFGAVGAPAIQYWDLFPTRRLVSLTVTPSGTNISTPIQQFTATATYDDDSTEDVTGGVHWHSDDETKMTVDSAGLGTAVGAGAFNMYATIGRHTDGAFNIVE